MSSRLVVAIGSDGRSTIGMAATGQRQPGRYRIRASGKMQTAKVRELRSFERTLNAG